MLSDGRIASSSFARTIKIYNIKDYHCDISIEEHKDAVISIAQLDNGKLVSCSDDKTIQIWTISNFSYQCVHLIQNATQKCFINITSLSNGRMATSSNDEIIKIWKSNFPYDLIIELKGEQHCSNSIIQLESQEILLCGSIDGILQIWNINTYQIDLIITNTHCNSIDSLIELPNNKILMGSPCNISIVNSITFTIEQSISIEQIKAYSFVMINNDHILFSTKEG